MDPKPLQEALHFPSQLSSDMEKARRRRPRFRSSWSTSLLTSIVAAVGLIALFGIVHSYMTRQLDPRGCKTPRMIPTYIKLDGFDTEHTRFSRKYSLYLYRERGVDFYDEDNLGLKGVPVLFLPGNAGSYRQGRSLASEASIYFRDVLQHDQDKLQAGVRGLDFFLADFNEDMAAFHGQTLLDQAEYINDALAYILSLYQDPRRSGRDANLPDPSSVILIGHSMGGVVARAVLTMSNYQANTVNTIITMSTPHALPPASFDADIVATYKQINDYWRESYLQQWANNNPLWHVTLISIAGGSGDSVVPSDYTSLASLVPETHGFTVFTTTMPRVWTGVDHLSIAWCDAFRKSVIQALYDVIDVRRISQTKQRAERMGVFKRRFLTGLEDNAEVRINQGMPNTLLTLDDDKKPLLKLGERLVIRNFGQEKQFKVHLLPVPVADGPGTKFTLLTDQVLDGPGGHGKAEVLLCTAFPLKKGASVSQLTYTIDLSQGNAAATRLACKGASDDVIDLPASTRNSRYPFDDAPPFPYLQYNLEDLTDFQFVAVVERSDRPSPGWLIAEFSNSSDAVIAANVGLGRLLTRGLHVELPASRPFVTEIKIPSLRSSLLAYRLKIAQKSCDEGSELFTPMIRQYLSDPYESKYFVNVKSVDVNLHGTAPYMPPHLKGGPPVSGVSFQIWSDPSCATPVKVDLEIDVLGSLGKLTMGYRTIFASFLVLTIAFILRKQFQVYDTTGVFVSFLESLDLTLRSSLPVFLLALTLLSTSLSSPSHSTLVEQPTVWLANLTTAAHIDYEKNDMLLGSPDSFFWFLIPLFGAISVGACVISNYLVVAFTEVLCAIWSLWRNRSEYVKHDQARGNWGG
ncbi:GPI inositol deacylase [Ascosphaera aggregata]|nr:GPI inositol deacylase [Ascosphaera aggregata]